MSKPQIKIWRGFGTEQHPPSFNRVENKRATDTPIAGAVATGAGGPTGACGPTGGWVDEWFRESEKARSVSQVGTMRTKIIP